jgi:hypothetical protein
MGAGMGHFEGFAGCESGGEAFRRTGFDLLLQARNGNYKALLAVGTGDMSSGAAQSKSWN